MFLTQKGPPFGFFRKLRLNFQIDLKALWAAGPYSRGQNIIKLGQKMDFDLVSDGPRRPKFLAGLQPKLSTVGGFFLTPPIVNLTPFFCAWWKNFQLLMSFLFEDFNTSQSCQIFDLLVKILKNFPTKISNLPHFQVKNRKIPIFMFFSYINHTFWL